MLISLRDNFVPRKWLKQAQKNGWTIWAHHETDKSVISNGKNSYHIHKTRCPTSVGQLVPLWKLHITAGRARIMGHHALINPLYLLSQSPLYHARRHRRPCPCHHSPHRLPPSWSGGRCSIFAREKATLAIVTAAVIVLSLLGGCRLIAATAVAIIDSSVMALCRRYLRL